jgi:putative sigma-54 modulation protein
MTTPSQLQIQCVFKGMDGSDALKEYASKKAEKIVKHTHHIVNCHFVFHVEREEHVAELHVVSGDFEAKADARSENMYASVDEVTDKVVHQARKFNDKHRSRTGKPHHNRDSE